MKSETHLKKAHRIKRQSLPEILAESLRERILNGEFKPGEALIQEALAEEYECSRMPVREAFRQLEAAGLIVTKVHKGAVVAAMPAEQAMELFELRATLECILLEHAIPNMTSEDLDGAARVLGELDKAYLERDINGWGALNWEFHRKLYLPAKRTQTLSIVHGINLQVERYIRLELLISKTFEKAQREHSALLKACRDRDSETALKLLNQHILEAGESLVQSLEEKSKPS
ncbi:GntR family transcriptional regulator [Shimia sp.]|uniref:GntR family transcriptional regulator n=1 Tax=Shimia sp. TaxID=1954381 RepID=UPI0032987453